ncbi:prepilin-type N-terminal cleavage/methylation domain-containing protein [Sphingomonas sp. MMS12-HWE2-04]|uniref:prepilin-type N-terminal cleavage/methylation domain-containing protein n=1 Tax=Sphingomonas sp. MMS12-HWE2-04 TaxID=3234199 RepID=UPI00384DDDB4
MIRTPVDPPAARPDASDAGFTLIELMISMALFALIAVAGLALVEGIIKVQGRTEQRLDRLADLQRTMFVVASDLDQIASGRMTGGGTTLGFTRAAPGIGGAAVPLRYTATGGALVRSIGPAPQVVLGGITAARWRFWDGAWADRWPVSDEGKERWPRAVELEMQVAGPGGTPVSLRRVVALPARPEEANQ